MKTTGDNSYRYTAVGGNTPKLVDDLKDVIWSIDDDKEVKIKILDRLIKEKEEEI